MGKTDLVPLWQAAQRLGLNVQNVEQMVKFHKLSGETDRFGRDFVDAADLERLCKQRAKLAKERAKRREQEERRAFRKFRSR